MPDHSTPWVDLITTDAVVSSQELREMLPQLTDDLRQHVASYLPFVDRARCLLLTTSILNKEGTAPMLDKLEITCKLKLRLGQMEKARQAKLAATAKAPELPDPAPNQSTRECLQSYHDALVVFVHIMQSCQKELLEAVTAFQTDHQLKRLIQHDLPVAEMLAQLQCQTQCDEAQIKECHDSVKKLSSVLQAMPVQHQEVLCSHSV